MELLVQKSTLSGRVEIPASKSHTIRAVCIASLADGFSEIQNPLAAADTLAAVRGCRALGVEITEGENWSVRGTGGELRVPDDAIDVGNSGTSLYILMGMAALADGWTIFTGDHQIRTRPAMPLIEALNNLGAQAFSTRANGMPPLAIRGPLEGGYTDLDGSKTSQYLTSLLINCPLAEKDTVIRPRDVIEKPFIEMTLGWLAEQGMEVERDGYEEFKIRGRQRYHSFSKRVPADFSSAAFFLCAAAITGSELVLGGLDMNDTQGDKAVVNMLAEMGAEVETLPDGIRIKGGRLRGGEFDLNATPDALPALAMTACFAEGSTKLANVPQARLKETDRIRVMCEELTKMGAIVRELPDGMIIYESKLHAANVHGWADHRVVMALAVAGLACEGETRVDTAEAMQVTFPSFVHLMSQAGARMSITETRKDGNQEGS